MLEKLIESISTITPNLLNKTNEQITYWGLGGDVPLMDSELGKYYVAGSAIAIGIYGIHKLFGSIGK